MGELITVNGTEYKVFGRKATAEFIPGTSDRHILDKLNARGRVYLVKSHGGSHVYEGTERGDGRITGLYDTHTTVTGRGVR
jgi:hypothetical protein